MNSELIGALEEIEKDRGINKETLLEALEAALISAYRRHFGTAENVEVTVNRETGDIKVIARRDVVPEVENPLLEISLEEARGIDPAYRVGDRVEKEITPNNFGRIAAQTAKQVVMQRIREAERGVIYDEFASREEDIVTGVVRRIQGRNVYIDLGRTEAVLMPSEQIPGEYYRQGERIKAYIVEVKKTTKGPQVMVSRSHQGLLRRLFELEVPEIHEGLVEIVKIAREAGARSKIAVRSRDANVDAVGACVGAKGMRVQTVVNELKGEKIDVVRWSEDTQEFVANALSPAKVSNVRIHPMEKVAQVTVPDFQLSLAIGKEGQNARLAAKLTGWKIDIRSESQAEADIDHKEKALLAVLKGEAGFPADDDQDDFTLDLDGPASGAPLRIFELARQTGVSSKKIMELLQGEFGLQFKSHMNTIDPGLAEQVVRYIAELKEDDLEEETTAESGTRDEDDLI